MSVLQDELRKETLKRIRLQDAMTFLRADVLLPLCGLATICKFVSDEVPHSVQLGNEEATTIECLGRLLELLADQADRILSALDDALAEIDEPEQEAK